MMQQMAALSWIAIITAVTTAYDLIIAIILDAKSVIKRPYRVH